MFDYDRFKDVFPYDDKYQKRVDERRKQLSGSLLIYRVMETLSVSESNTYPPKSEAALKQIHRRICDAPIATHHKLSLLYYLLLDFDTDENDLVSGRFAAAAGMPKDYQVFMKGLWYMDRREYKKALEYLTYPPLTPDFADEIISTLVRNASGNDFSLALSYFHTMRPILKSPYTMEVLFDAMTRMNATEALLYSRTHPHHTRELLFRRWAAVLVRGGGKGDAHSQMGELAFMPLDAEEESWLTEYLSTGEGRTVKKAKDLLLFRKVACRKSAAASQEPVGGQWLAMLEGIKKGIPGPVS